MMKKKVIRITDLSEIDTSKISVYDLNNRYIDQDGIVYGLKYNRLRKKIDIIRLVKAHSAEAASMEQQVHLKQRKERMEVEEGTPSPDEMVAEVEEREDYDLESRKDLPLFNPGTFIHETLQQVSNHISRIKSIMKNIKDSNVFDYNDKTISTTLDDLFRNLEIEGIEKLEKLVSYEYEMKNYPRSITYYEARLPHKAIDFIKKLGEDNERVMTFIYNCEIHDVAKTTYTTFQKHLINLSDFIDETISLSESGIHANRSLLDDARTTINSTSNEIEVLFEQLNLYEQFMYELDSYS